jgi:RTX calcium-binding nonapeptide repeat (4 copies)/Cadherin domain
MATIKFGSQFLINTQASLDQDNVSLAGLANGLFVAVYEARLPDSPSAQDDNDLQVFNANGSKRGAETNLTPSVFGNVDPAVAAAPDATFYTANMTLPPSGSTSVFATRFDIDLNVLPSGSLNMFGSVGIDESNVAIAVRADGGRFGVYQFSSDPAVADDPNILGVFFSPNHPAAVSFGDLVTVNSVTAGTQARPDVAALDSGRFVTVWESGSAVVFRFTDVTYGPDPNFLNPSPPIVGIVTNVGTDIGIAAGTRPAVAALPGDRFVVLWYDGVAANQILGRVYDSNGVNQGNFVAATNVEHNPGLDRDIAVAVAPNGTFLVSWTGIPGTINGDTSGTYIDAALFDSTKPAGSGAFTVFSATTVAGLLNESLTTFTAGNQFDPSLAALADGRFVLGWTDASASSGDTSGLAVRGQILDFRNAAVAVSGTSGHDDYIGTDLADTLSGLAGDDTLTGGRGNDTLDGGADIDKAVFSGARSQYRIDQLGNGDRQVVDLRPGSPDGTDTLHDVENLVFSDGTFVTTTVINQAPVINSDGGATNAAVPVAENSAAVTTVTATDPDHFTTLVFSIVGGADAARFQIGATTGVLAFIAAPDFEAPADNGADNSYVVQVRASDGGLTDEQTITVNVTDLNDQSGPIPPPSPVGALFDAAFYLSHNADVAHAGVDAFIHFNTFGSHEGRDPNAFFDTSGYLAINKNIAAAGINPLEHFHQFGWKEGRDPSADFDIELYLVQNPDVAAAHIDPLEHFLRAGQFEGRSAFAAIGQGIINGFDAEFYLFHNPDVAAAGVDPFLHYDVAGRFEGRNPNAWFDTAGYLSHYADVAAAGINPLLHYEQVGWTEGRDPSAEFDTLGYLAANPDVAAAHVNPLDHFLKFGIYEGRTPVNDGLFH